MSHSLFYKKLRVRYFKGQKESRKINHLPGWRRQECPAMVSPGQRKVEGRAAFGASLSNAMLGLIELDWGCATIF